MSALSVAAQRGATAADRLARWLVGVRPLYLFVPLVAAQLAEVAFFALRTPHNGWIWYSGGDATSYWTEQFAVSHLQIPQAVVGYGLPVFYGWVPLLAGPSLITGVSIIVVFQALVLVPLALILFWAVADRLFGRVFAWAAAAAWVLAPLVLLLGFVDKYHWIFDQLFLAPHWYGLTNMADMPSLVIVLATMWLTLRAYDTGSLTDALLGGLLAGLAIGVKPSNAFLLPAVAVLLIATRNLRLISVWVVAIVPALITLTLWKYRGLGYLPATSSSYEHLRLAAGAAPVVAVATSKYLPFNFHHFGEELANLREVFWSLRLLEFLAFAGAFGVIRKSTVKGLFVVVWFASYGIIKTSSVRSDFPSATYFRLGEPGLPAYLLLVLGIAFCIPSLGRRVAAAPRPAVTSWHINRRVVVPAVVVLALIPLLLVLVLRNPSTPSVARDGNVVQEAPLTKALHPTAHRNADGTVTLSWRKLNYGKTQPSYLVYLSTTASDNGCTPPPGGGNECMLDTMDRLGLTFANRFVDRPRFVSQGRWYRIAVLATYQHDNPNGDLMLVSSPVLAPPARS
jgi:Dolichyl-phosphate-mannose-protein mannosyltransferase